jgi:uncharacterized protein YegL
MSESYLNENELAIIRVEDLVENPTTRVPVCLCLDVSGSMSGRPIDELNEGIKMFYNAIMADDIAKYAAEICIVSFGANENAGKVEVDFANIDRQQIPTLRAIGMTPMGEGVNLALDKLEARKQEYNSRGVDYYQPWLVLMTDGRPNGNVSELQRAIQRVTGMVDNKKLTVFPIGIGDNADMSVLAKFSPGRTPLKLKGLDFKAFFQWLSKSVSTTSQSMPGTVIPLDLDSIKGWGTL